MLRDVQLMTTISQRRQTANHLLIFQLLKNLKKEAHRKPRNQRISSSIRKHKHLASPNICLANGQVELDLVLAALGITLQNYNSEHLNKLICRLGWSMEASTSLVQSPHQGQAQTLGYHLGLHIWDYRVPGHQFLCLAKKWLTPLTPHSKLASGRNKLTQIFNLFVHSYLYSIDSVPSNCIWI